MDADQFIQSGIVEAFVLGIASTDENAEVEAMASRYPQVEQAINRFSSDIERQARVGATAPPPVIKTNVMAAIDFMNRKMKGEADEFPPLLIEDSKIEDYSEWLNRPDMVVSEDFEGIFARIIGHTKEMTTVIGWMKEMYSEIHTDHTERFLVVEGSCVVTIDEKVYHLFPGDVFTIPPGKKHHAVSTSVTICKVILQKLRA